MARSAKLHNPRPFAFGLEPRQVLALKRYRRRHRLGSDAQAVRHLLNLVAETEDVSLEDYPTGEPCSSS